MRILIVTNFYPPYELGGQGRSCKQVVDGLRKRGHQITILTSTHTISDIEETEVGVLRKLQLEMDLVPLKNSIKFFTQRRKAENSNLAWLDRLIDIEQPEIIFIWGMWNLHRSLAARAERKLKGRVVYRFAEYWPTLPSQYELYWRSVGRNSLTRIPKQFVGRIALSILEKEETDYRLLFENCICVSAATREELVNAGVPVSHAKIIHTGLDLSAYRVRADPCEHSDQGFSLLYAGRMTEEKGLGTLLRAFDILKERFPDRYLTLNLAGGGSDEFVSSLRRLALELGINQSVKFLGRIPPDRMPEIYEINDCLVLPSEWQEPFARVILEGMASGLVVVASSVGGSGEIISSGENGLIFEASNAEDLADQLARIIEDPNLCELFVRSGIRTVHENFSITKMLDEYENYLLNLQAVRVGRTAEFTGN